MKIPITTMLGLLILASSVHAQRGGSRSDWMKRYDTNGDGMLDQNELKDRRGRYFVEQAARRAGLDPSQPISIAKLSGSSNSDGDRRDRDRRSDRGDRNRWDRNSSSRNDSKSNKSKEDGSGVPGFSLEASVEKVPGFDIPVDKHTANSKYLTKIPLEDQYEDYILRYVDRNILGYYDANKNQILEPDEAKKVRWSDDPKQDDTNKDGRYSRAELAGRMARKWGKGRKKTSTGSTASSQSQSKYRDYARSMIRQYDKNHNGYLEKEEWKRMSSFNRGSDSNHDGIITLDELAARLSSYGNNSSSGVSVSYSSSSNRSSRKRRGWTLKANNDKWYGKKSYRASSATELLPDGLPKWFAQKDANGDGQIAMSEYSITWNKIDLEEYHKYDTNGDGLITPQEVLGVQKK